MRKDNVPTDKQLKVLYQEAVRFKEVQPWKWLYDADIICVENPKDKTIGYCSVMGKGGEHFGLGVYLGDEGLYGLYNMMENADTIPSHQLLHLQNCLMCSFEDRNQLTSDDGKQIKALGLSFRGRNAWPRFCRFEPGYYPWHINKEESVFLTHALRQALFVAINIMDGKLKIDMEQGKTIIRYSEDKDGKLEWYSREVELGFPSVIYHPVKIDDDLLIRRIRNLGSIRNITLQVDNCYMPSPVQENRNERPYFPRIFIIANQKSGYILDFEMYENISDDADVTIKKLIDMFIEKGRSKEIRVRSDAMFAILTDLCKKTGIKLKKVKRLPVIDHLIEEVAYRF